MLGKRKGKDKKTEPSMVRSDGSYTEDKCLHNWVCNNCGSEMILHVAMVHRQMQGKESKLQSFLDEPCKHGCSLCDSCQKKLTEMIT